MTGIDNLLTIDVEDYFHVENLKTAIKTSDWDNFESRVVDNTKKILSLLDKNSVKITFFVLGWVAERFPDLVREIHSHGHEIASHGYEHRLIYNQSPSEFREDLRKSKLVLEKIINEPIIGYRAPCYSITKKSEWAIEILMEEGFKYDSSLFPIKHDRGGYPGSRRYPYTITNHNKNMMEFPISTINVSGYNLPFSGGGYFRLLPYSLVEKCVRRVNNAGHPVIMYLHPWEFDPGQPRINAGALNSFRHYVNLDKTEKKFEKLLKTFNFCPIKKCLS